MKKIVYLIFLFLLIFNVSFNFLFAQTKLEDKYNCFSILVGRGASVDSSVLFAHNEDDYGKQIVNWYKVPHLFHKNREEITLQNGAVINQIKETNSYLWLEMPGMKFSDTYMNEYGVTIASDACRSKEKQGRLENGGIGYWLRRLMAERARTAKEAVKIAGHFVDKLGYISSGRTYCIADSDEAWVLAVVQGKHWVAQRVPDNQVVIIPNYYTITNIDLSDTNNFLGSKDIIDYAVKKGWYNPEKDGEFNFRLAYGDSLSLSSISNIARKWRALNLLSKKQYNIDDEFPFAFYAEKKVSKEDLIKILRDQYEGTKFETNDRTKNKKGVMSICSKTNQYGFVAQLRNWLPVDIGAVLWIAPRRPCSQAFIPWYSGITTIPKPYASYYDYETAIKNHFSSYRNIYKQKSNIALFTFYDFDKNFDENHSKKIDNIYKKNKFFERKLLKRQAEFEKRTLCVYRNNPLKAKKILTRYSYRIAVKVWKLEK